VLLFLHGGGFELGSVRSDGELAARLGRADGMRVLFPEYRLAPEHPFPAAIDDVLAAWRWLRTGQGPERKLNSGRRRLGRRRARRRPARGHA
jgi:monoterpene epsilon-lactone hydrolase